MTIQTRRTWLRWSPLVGWALLSCSASVVHAQSPTQSDVDPGSVLPSVPPGGAADPIITPISPDDSFKRDADRRAGRGSLKMPEATLTAPDVPSAGFSIVNAPFGSSIPYYGGNIFVSGDLAGGSGGPGPLDQSGIGLGSFILVPQLELNIGVDSNVFAQPASGPPVSSMYATVTPSFDLRSDWLNHSLHVLASGTLGWYGNAPTQNYQNYGIIVDGRVDIYTDVYATWLTGFRRSTEALGTPNVSFAQAPTVVDTLPIEFGLYQQFNRVFYQLGVRATRYWYYDYSTISGFGLPGSSRERWEYSESLKIGYQLFEDLDVFVAPSIGQIRYIERINSAGQSRDSDSMNVSVGSTWRINPISVLEGSIGYQSSNYESGLGNTSAWAFGLAGTWTGYAPLTLRPYISRSIAETSLSQYKNYVATTFAVDYNYLIHDAWTLAGGFLFTMADYSPIEGTGATPRTDYFMRAQIGLLYSIRPEVQIGPFFEYSRGSSTDSTGPSYDRQIYSIRLIAKR
jgi:hypothetical protein